MKSKVKKIYWTAAAAVMTFIPAAAFAADGNALSIINNLKTLMLDILAAIGVIAIIWGVVQVAMGFKSQDGTQKTQGLLFLAGGALMATIKAVLTALGVA